MQKERLITGGQAENLEYKKDKNTRRENRVPSIEGREKEEADVVRRIEALQDKINTQEPKTGEVGRDEKVIQFRDRYLPVHLESPRPSVIKRAFSWAIGLKERISGREVVGRENIPEQGPFLIVCNHFGGETGPLMSLFGEHNLHVAAGEETNWKRSGFRSWLLKKLGMLSVKESAANLSSEQRQELLQRVPGSVRQAAYSRIFENSDQGVVNNLPFVRAAIAAMSRGDAIAVFPEGIFSYEKEKSLKQAYGGFDFLAKKFKELTGKELRILPVGMSGKRIVIQPSVSYEENLTDMDNEDWIMAQIAKCLPQEQRGYYRELAEKL